MNKYMLHASISYNIIGNYYMSIGVIISIFNTYCVDLLIYPYTMPMVLLLIITYILVNTMTFM